MTKYYIKSGSTGFLVNSFDKMMNLIRNNKVDTASIILDNVASPSETCYYSWGKFNHSKYMTNKQLRIIQKEFGELTPRPLSRISKYQRLKKKKQLVANWNRMNRDQRSIYITTKANAIPSKAPLQDRINFVVGLLIDLGCKDVIF